VNFDDKMRVAIFGSSGGIGTALVDQLGNDPRVARLYPISRTKTCSETLILDYDDEKTISAAAELIKADGPLDLVIVASGLLHDSNGLLPEKTFRSLESASLEKLYRVNVIGPALVAKHFIPLLSPDRKNVFATLGARVGSITDNNLGGWYSYRMAKAALVMLTRTLAVESARRNAFTVCVALHPGTVNTALSKPFQRSVADGTLVSPSNAAANLLRVIDGVDPSQSGHHLAWDGTQIPY
tara:strand:+ start:1381 stop:2100 length:720 start_codon:yes stop_codon:yes gene_type:complete